MSKEAQQKNEISYPLILMHLGCLGIFFVPFSTSMLLVFLTIYCLHVFTLTAGYHRYFSHKSFKTSRIFQFILAFLGTMAAQKDPLWWASHHRLHHEHADKEEDPHSPKFSNNFVALMVKTYYKFADIQSGATKVKES